MFYRTQITKIGAGYAVDTSGKRLRFIGNYPCQAGDYVWTDGTVIFGNISVKPQPVIFDDVKSGIPILAYDKDWGDDDTSISYYDKDKEMRGYFDSSGKFIDYVVAQNYSELDFGDFWFVNNKKKVFLDFLYIEKREIPEDVEVTDDSRVFAISRYKDDDDLYMAVDSIDYGEEYHFEKNVDDFKQSSSGNEIIELLFLKLQKSENKTAPVKWFAVFQTTATSGSTAELSSGVHYTFEQSAEVTQEISLTQAGVWKCSVKINEEEVPRTVSSSRRKIKIFSVDSDGEEKAFYEYDEKSIDVGDVYTEKLVPQEIDEVRRGYGPAPMYYDNFATNYVGGHFEGEVKIEWVGIGVSRDTFKGTIYRVETVKEDIEVSVSSIEENHGIEYPVQDGIYIKADDLVSPLKLYDSEGKMILNFETSGDDFLADLTGFHNFAAIKINKDTALLTMHDINPETKYTKESKKGRFWIIKNGRAEKINELCHNFRFCKIKDIKKSRKV